MPSRSLLIALALFAGATAVHAAKPPKVQAIPDAALPAGPRELAFPGAEGFGAHAHARGGRGGPVLRVTTLKDHNRPRSLRWAIAQPGPRIVQFDVSGTLSRRDAIDERLVRQYRSGAGKVINRQDDVGGYGR